MYAAIKSNNLVEANQILKEDMSYGMDWKSLIGRSYVSEEMNNLLIQYQILKDRSLNDFMNQDYADKGNINLLVISSRGYLPLLQLKQDELSTLVNHQNIDGNTALHFALSNHNNIKLVSFLYDKGANVLLKNKDGQSPLDIVKVLSATSKGYKELYNIWIDKLPSYLDVVPGDILGIVGDYLLDAKAIIKETDGDPVKIVELCNEIDRRIKTGCGNENSELWRQLYIEKFEKSPDDQTAGLLFDNFFSYEHVIIKDIEFTIKEKYLIDYYQWGDTTTNILLEIGAGTVNDPYQIMIVDYEVYA